MPIFGLAAATAEVCVNHLQRMAGAPRTETGKVITPVLFIK
jgi:hypothetical protein